MVTGNNKTTFKVSKAGRDFEIKMLISPEINNIEVELYEIINGEEYLSCAYTKNYELKYKSKALEYIGTIHKEIRSL